jgi:hypothetical protein
MDLSSSLLVYFGVRFSLFWLHFHFHLRDYAKQPAQDCETTFSLVIFFLCLVIYLRNYNPPEIVMILLLVMGLFSPFPSADCPACGLGATLDPSGALADE